MNLESELLSRLNMTDAGTGSASRADMQICTCKASVACRLVCHDDWPRCLVLEYK